MEVCDELKALRDTEERELGVQNMNHRRRKKKKKRFCRFTVLGFSSDVNEIRTDFHV